MAVPAYATPPVRLAPARVISLACCGRSPTGLRPGLRPGPQSSGAYGEETLEPGLSVRAGSTAIPTFVGEFGDALDTVTAVASWPDFTQALEAAGAKDASATALSAVLRG
ncbi:hypothetical protein AB0K71_12370 [Streptomyces syringium]|uniref:hypothetical protein n=1 Tax=Streptomyces syringium TaxID=76729 RepID=UPI00341D1E74